MKSFHTTKIAREMNRFIRKIDNICFKEVRNEINNKDSNQSNNIFNAYTNCTITCYYWCDYKV
jgi:PHP family Zn ribbon phosphoesterase